MHILVLNSGSSSIKFSIFDSGLPAQPGPGDDELILVLDGELDGIGSVSVELKFRSAGEAAEQTRAGILAKSSAEAIGHILEVIARGPGSSIDAIGYRIVHPGPKVDGHRRITPEVLNDLEEATVFAPLHNPQAIEIVREVMSRFPDTPHFACFDTVFHGSMPPEATAYALPSEYAEQGVRRYGFHGLSCEWIVHAIRREHSNVPKRMVIAHLGSGCSVTALVDGRSVDTSMGLTPTGGVVMGTRPGDLDPGLLLYLIREEKSDGESAIAKVETMLNHASGMVALSGLPNDMRAVRKAAASGDTQAGMALKVFTRCVRKAIGAYCWLMGGVDAIVFTGGIGEHDADSRQEILEGLEEIGITIDDSRNQRQQSNMRRISRNDSSTSVLVVPAQEDRMIALHVDRMMRSNP
jgi:acetate kinase